MRWPPHPRWWFDGRGLSSATCTSVEYGYDRHDEDEPHDTRRGGGLGGNHWLIYDIHLHAPGKPPHTLRLCGPGPCLPRSGEGRLEIVRRFYDEERDDLTTDVSNASSRARNVLSLHLLLAHVSHGRLGAQWPCCVPDLYQDQSFVLLVAAVARQTCMRL